MRRYVALLSVFAALAISLAAQTPTVSRDLPNFYKVNENLYRGGQPSETGFAELKRIGIKTVIDLRDNDEKASKETALVERAGMRFITGCTMA